MSDDLERSLTEAIQKLKAATRESKPLLPNIRQRANPKFSDLSQIRGFPATTDPAKAAEQLREFYEARHKRIMINIVFGAVMLVVIVSGIVVAVVKNSLLWSLAPAAVVYLLMVGGLFATLPYLATRKLWRAASARRHV